MSQPELLTVGALVYWSYANLAMAHAAVRAEATRYGPVHFMIRARLYSGLCKGTMSVGSLAEDERLKMVLPQACCYCGSHLNLTVDHLIPRKRGGADRGDNLVWACQSCNSSKGAQDVLEWLTRQGRFPPLLLLRRYLKLVIEMSHASMWIDIPLNQAPALPFSLEAIPRTFPRPADLILWIFNLDDRPARS